MRGCKNVTVSAKVLTSQMRGDIGNAYITGNVHYSILENLDQETKAETILKREVILDARTVQPRPRDEQDQMRPRSVLPYLFIKFLSALSKVA